MSRLNWERFGISDVGKYDIVVGIDFGHRQMSAHYVKLFNSSDEKYYKNEPTRAYMTHDEKSVIPTQFAKHENKIYIGDDAKGYNNIYIYFKKDPEKLNKSDLYETGNITCKELVQEFISKVIENIEKYNADLERKKILYIIGCPSGDVWFRDNNDVEYAKILKEKNNRDIVVMHESRGSLIKLKNEKSISFKKKQGILVFDFGSSTADWTFMYKDANDVTRMIDDTWMLGASLIDKKIMDIVLEKNNITRKELKKYVDAQIDTISAKEIGYDAYGSDKDITNRVFYDLTDDDEISGKITSEVLDKATDEREISFSTAKSSKRKGTWEELCRDFMKSALARINEALDDIKIEKIMLTGGASKMYFVKNICKDVFGYSDDNIIIDSEPSACVSKGLALAGQADIEAQILVEEIRNKAEKHIKEEHVDIPWEIAYKISEDDDFYNQVFYNTLDTWTSSAIEDLSPESTIRHFMLMTNEAGKAKLDSEFISGTINSVIENTVEKYTDYIKVELQTTVKAHYGSDIPDNLNINLSKSIEELSEKVKNLQIKFISDDTAKKMLGFMNGTFVDIDAPRYLRKSNVFGGALESRWGLRGNYSCSKSDRDDDCKCELRRSLRRAIEENDNNLKLITDLKEEINRKIFEGIDEVIDSMALYAEKG